MSPLSGPVSWFILIWCAKEWLKREEYDMHWTALNDIFTGRVDNP